MQSTDLKLGLSNKQLCHQPVQSNQVVPFSHQRAIRLTSRKKQPPNKLTDPRRLASPAALKKIYACVHATPQHTGISALKRDPHTFSCAFRDDAITAFIFRVCRFIGLDYDSPLLPHCRFVYLVIITSAEECLLPAM